MQGISELDVAVAWSISFILLHTRFRFSVEQLVDLYKCLDRPAVIRATSAAVQMGLIIRTRGGRFEVNNSRSTDILTWHEWTDVGLIKNDARKELYDALLGAFATHLRAKKDPMAEPEVLAGIEDLKRIPHPQASVAKLGHRKPPKWCSVYFIQMGADGPIKIGWAVNVNSRLAELQCASPFDLSVRFTAPGDVLEEGLLHGKFSRSRLRGEWFRPTPELLDFIERKPENLYDACTDRLGWPSRMMVWTTEVQGTVSEYLARALARLMGPNL
jgi:hypothetical protein